MARRKKGRVVDGILLLDKPLGISSNDALQKVKRLYQAQKAGHTGTLDPLADGMLPLCFGHGTKVSHYLTESNKTYFVRVKLGQTTSTGDLDGEVTSEHSIDGITRESIEQVIPEFLGEIMQVPPMYSALKHEGKRLYDLARQGIEVEREARPVTIHSIDLGAFADGEFEMTVVCSKGTYIRTLAEDMGEKLGCGAHVVRLRRTGVGPYANLPLHTLDELIAVAEQGQEALDALLIPIDTALEDWPVVNLGEDAAHYIKFGNPVRVSGVPKEGWVRLYEADGERFIGLGEIDPDGNVAPRRLMLPPEVS